MRLRFWSSRATWKGWQGRGLTWQHTLAGCKGSKFYTPPMSKMPCCVDDCKRCAAHVGGFKFPWLGLWNSRGVVLPDDVAPTDAWDYYYQHQDPMDLLLVAAYTSFKGAADVVPQDVYGLQLRCTAGDAGQLGMGEMFDQWRTWIRCVGTHELLPIFIEPRLFPRAPRGATLASLGTGRCTGSSSTMWLVGRPRCRSGKAWHCLHRMR